MNIRHNVRGIFSGLLGRQRDAGAALDDSNHPTTAPESDATLRERRLAPRRYGDPVEVRLKSYEHADANCGSTGWVRDRSQGGLALSTDKPLDVGTWLRIRPTIVPDDVAWVDVLVKDVRPQGPRWVLGCQFVEEPPRELLLLFR
jgi:hypothetical protein